MSHEHLKFNIHKNSCLLKNLRDTTYKINITFSNEFPSFPT